MPLPTEVSFRAIIPSIGTAIRFAGDGGMRITLDVAETDEANALPILAMREQVLEVRIKVAREQVQRAEG